MKVKAIQPFDGFQIGDEPDLPPAYAQGVVKKGLAKAMPEHQNKMADAADNKMDAKPARQAGKTK